MTFYYYLKQSMRMCEIRLNQILAKNTGLTFRPKGYSSYPSIRN